jgi:hypothetical protein
MVMARSGMILMEVLVQVPEGAVVGAMLGLAIESFLVRTPVRLVDLAVESPVRVVIASVLTVIVIMGERSSGRCRDGQHSHCNEGFTDGHGVSPVKVPDAAGTVLAHRTTATLNLTATLRLGAVHGRQPSPSCRGIAIISSTRFACPHIVGSHFERHMRVLPTNIGGGRSRLNN